MASLEMRGLRMFIGDIRAVKTNKDKQKLRVDKEMAHIRQKFTSRHGIDGYGKKKYVWKLLYIYLMGFEVDVGHMEALQLLTSNKWSEKTTGYMACSIFLNENHELLRLIIQAVKNDLNSKNHVFQSLALDVIANVGGQEFAENLVPDVQRLLLAGTSREAVKKKSALALLRLFRKYPEALSTEVIAPRLLTLLDDHSLGVVVSVASLLLGILSYSTEGYEALPARAANLLYNMIIHYKRYPDYRYYHTINPWLQIKLLRMLQFFPPVEDEHAAHHLHKAIEAILTKTQVTQSVNKNNADHGVLFEAINYVVHTAGYDKTDFQREAIVHLGRFISVKEPNIRYLALDTMARATRIADILPKLRKHQKTIQYSLREGDISIRKRALDLLYAMCDQTNAIEIVEELMGQLDKSSVRIKEELVLKIAILAEKFARDLRWYIDIVLRLIAAAGDYVTDDIWYRSVIIVTNNENLQEYAATTMFKAMADSSIHENGVKVGGYIIGEFGHHIQNVSGQQMLALLLERFRTASLPTRALLLSAMVKLANTYPEIKPKVNSVLQEHRDHGDAELQQRAVEYGVLALDENDELMTTVFEIMPPYEERESALEKRIKKLMAKKGNKDLNIAGKKADDDDEDEESSDEESDTDEESDSDEESDDEDDEAEAEGVGETGGAAASVDIMGALDDILGEGDGAAAPAAGGADVFDDAVFGGTPVAAGLPAQDLGLVAAGAMRGDSMVYDSDVLQVRVRVLPLDGAVVKMIISLGNKTGAGLNNVQVSLSDSVGNAYLSQIKPVDSVPAGSQAPVYVKWLAAAPADDGFPTMTIAFNSGGAPQSVDVALPLVTSNFMSAAQHDISSIKAAWKSNTAVAKKVYETVEGVTIQGDDVRNSLLPRLGAAAVEGVEKTADNVMSAGTLMYGRPSAAAPVVVRFETKAPYRHVRVTVRSPSQEVSDAVLRDVGLLIAGGL